VLQRSKDIYWQWREEEPLLTGNHNPKPLVDVLQKQALAEQQRPEKDSRKEPTLKRLASERDDSHSQERTEVVKKQRVDSQPQPELPVQSELPQSYGLGDAPNPGVTFTVTLSADLLTSPPATPTTTATTAKEIVRPPRAPDGTFKNMTFVAVPSTKPPVATRGRGSTRSRVRGIRGGFRGRGRGRGNLVWVASSTSQNST